MVMRAGWIGLGTLGSAMVRRLVDQGAELEVWNRSPGKAEALGAPVADSPAALAAAHDVVLLNLRDSAAVRAVLEGESGLLAGGLEGTLVIDTTTNHFDDVVGFHSAVAAAGGAYLEAPVAGSVVPASNGQLTVIASGDAAALERARPFLEILGKAVFHLPEPGAATRMKLVNNLVLGTLMAALAEAVAVAEAAGIPREQALDVLEAGAGNSAVLKAKRGKLLAEDFAVHFSVENIYKDLHFLQDLARATGRAAPTAAAAKELFGMARAAGLAEADFSAVLKVVSP